MIVTCCQNGKNFYFDEHFLPILIVVGAQPQIAGKQKTQFLWWSSN